MPHNLLIVNPGTIDEVSQKAIQLGENGYAKNYVPDSKMILHFTRLLNANGKQTIVFTAPSEPGDYPFVCTFPGHAFTMRGIMKVLSKQESFQLHTLTFFQLFRYPAQ